MHITNIFSVLDKENYGLIAFTALVVFLLFVLPGVGFKKDVTRISDSKKQAMYRRVRKADRLLSNRPEGLIFGKQGKQYIALPVGKENMRDGVSAVILGSPGSGKSVFLTNFLLNNFMQKNPTPVFCLDIKPELARKSVPLEGNDKVKVVDFTDRNKYQWYFSHSASQLHTQQRFHKYVLFHLLHPGLNF